MTTLGCTLGPTIHDMSVDAVDQFRRTVELADELGIQFAKVMLRPTNDKERLHGTTLADLADCAPYAQALVEKGVVLYAAGVDQDIGRWIGRPSPWDSKMALGQIALCLVMWNMMMEEALGVTFAYYEAACEPYSCKYMRYPTGGRADADWYHLRFAYYLERYGLTGRMAISPASPVTSPDGDYKLWPAEVLEHATCASLHRYVNWYKKDAGGKDVRRDIPLEAALNGLDLQYADKWAAIGVPTTIIGESGLNTWQPPLCWNAAQAFALIHTTVQAAKLGVDAVVWHGRLPMPDEDAGMLAVLQAWAQAR